MNGPAEGIPSSAPASDLSRGMIVARIAGRIAALSAGLAMAGSAALIGAPAASAAGNQIHNWNSGQCLGIYGASTSWGAQAIQWGCNGKADQSWYF